MIEISDVLREEIAKVSSSYHRHIENALAARESELPGISAYILPDHADRSKILRLVTPRQNIAIALACGVFLVVLGTFF